MIIYRDCETFWESMGIDILAKISYNPLDGKISWFR